MRWRGWRCIPTSRTSRRPGSRWGLEGAAACLKAGANDLGGTLMNESISRAAGTEHGQEFPPEAMEELIRSLGRDAGTADHALRPGPGGAAGGVAERRRSGSRRPDAAAETRRGGIGVIARPARAPFTGGLCVRRFRAVRRLTIHIDRFATPRCHDVMLEDISHRQKPSAMPDCSRKASVRVRTAATF